MVWFQKSLQSFQPIPNPMYYIVDHEKNQSYESLKSLKYRDGSETCDNQNEFDGICQLFLKTSCFLCHKIDLNFTRAPCQFY